MVLKGSAAGAIAVKLKSKGKPKALTGPENPWIDPQHYKTQFENSEVESKGAELDQKKERPFTNTR